MIGTSAAVRRRWPWNGYSPKMVQNLVGLSLTSLYRCEEGSGNLTDTIGGVTLTAAGTPVYGNVVGRKKGVGFDSTSDGFSADVHDLGTTSGLYFAVIYHADTPDTTVFGRLNAIGAEGVAVGVATPASGTLRCLVRDDGTNDLTLVPSLDVRGRTLIEVVQIDRTNTAARFALIEKDAATVSASGSISGFSTFTGASQGFGLCNFMPGVTSQTGSFTCLMLGVATGAQCEGAGVTERFRRLWP